MFQLLKDKEIFATSLYDGGLKCIDIVEATDRVQVIVKMFKTVEDIWSNSNCDGNIFIIMVSLC